MPLIVKMRSTRKVAGVEYRAGQEVDVASWPPRLATMLAEQGAFVSSPAAALAAMGVRPGAPTPAESAELTDLREVVEAMRASLRGQLEVDHKGHKAPVGECPSPRCAFLRAVLAIGAEPATSTVAA